MYGFRSLSLSCALVLVLAANCWGNPLSAGDGGGGSVLQEPSWPRRQLARIGETATKISGALGKTAVKIGTALDRLCDLFKQVVPVIAAVCHVGQFKFCTIEEVPIQLSPVLDLSVQD